MSSATLNPVLAHATTTRMRDLWASCILLLWCSLFLLHLGEAAGQLAVVASLGGIASRLLGFRGVGGTSLALLAALYWNPAPIETAPWSTALFCLGLANLLLWMSWPEQGVDNSPIEPTTPLGADPGLWQERLLNGGKSEVAPAAAPLERLQSVPAIAAEMQKGASLEKAIARVLERAERHSVEVAHALPRSTTAREVSLSRTIQNLLDRHLPVPAGIDGPTQAQVCWSHYAAECIGKHLGYWARLMLECSAARGVSTAAARYAKESWLLVAHFRQEALAAEQKHQQVLCLQQLQMQQLEEQAHQLLQARDELTALRQMDLTQRVRLLERQLELKEMVIEQLQRECEAPPKRKKQSVAAAAPLAEPEEQGSLTLEVERQCEESALALQLDAALHEELEALRFELECIRRAEPAPSPAGWMR